MRSSANLVAHVIASLEIWSAIVDRLLIEQCRFVIIFSHLFRRGERWTRLVKQFSGFAKVDLTMIRTIHHEDTQTVHG